MQLGLQMHENGRVKPKPNHNKIGTIVHDNSSHDNWLNSTLPINNIYNTLEGGSGGLQDYNNFDLASNSKAKRTNTLLINPIQGRAKSTLTKNEGILMMNINPQHKP